MSYIERLGLVAQSLIASRAAHPQPVSLTLATRGQEREEDPLAAAVLHFSGDDLPAAPIPPLRMTALRARPIAMPDLALMGRTRLERRMAAVGGA